MLIARKKHKENIAEYILYMWQVEDTIRACRFEMDLLEKHVISQFNESEKIKREIRDWYADLILAMHEEGLKSRGHMKVLNSLVDNLFDIHLKLVGSLKDPTYIKQFNITSLNIEEFERKLDVKPRNLVETCFNALYALLLLRIQKKEISEGTLDAMQTFSQLLALLSHWYKSLEDEIVKGRKDYGIEQ